MTDKKPTSIFLVGMMASGKSTIGRRLAERLGWAFYDADREIESRCGVPISFIFEKEGEAGFRARETQMLAELTAKDHVVVATGGGAPMFEINRKLLNRGLVIQLASSVSDIIERTMERVAFDASPSYDTYVQTDAEARRVARELMNN